MHPPRILGLVAGLIAVLTACTPAAAPVITPTPTPTPTAPMCVPEFGGDPYPCTTAEFDQMKLRDAEYDRAEAVYRRFFELTEEGALAARTEPSEEELSLVDGPYREVLTASYARGPRSNDMTQRIKDVRPWPKPTEYSEVVLSLMVCVERHGGAHDTSSLPGGAEPVTVEFSNESGLRIWGVSPLEGHSCAG